MAPVGQVVSKEKMFEILTENRMSVTLNKVPIIDLTFSKIMSLSANLVEHVYQALCLRLK